MVITFDNVLIRLCHDIVNSRFGYGAVRRSDERRRWLNGIMGYGIKTEPELRALDRDVVEQIMRVMREDHNDWHAKCPDENEIGSREG